MSWICSLNIDLSGRSNLKQADDFFYAVTFDNRFANDKTVFTNDGMIAVIDGVLLNKSELLEKYGAENLNELIEEKEGQINFFKEFIGPFSGFVYDIKKKQLTVFGNQTGDTCAFWYVSDDSFAASSDFNELMAVCKKSGVELTFNETAANHLLSLGFIVEGNTFAEQIKRTQPGEMEIIQCGNANARRYHLFDNTDPDETLSLDDAIEKVDIAFKKAVKRCFDKDLEYGYKHIADISGGLDSRMVNRVAKELGYRDITNISYAQNESKEFRCASKVSRFMGNSFIFKQLDDALFIYDIEKVVRLNYGLSVYYGITGGLRMLEAINFERFGLEHTGMIGDAVVGSFSKNENDTQIDVTRICYTDFIKPQLKNIDDYKNHEQFSMYYRAFQGAVITHYIRRNFTETVSPFMDVEFLQTCFDIPLEIRCKDRLYWAWLDKKYPDISHIPSTHDRPNQNKLSKENIYNKLDRKCRRRIIRFFKKIGLWRVVSPSSSMNPFEQWYAENSEIREFIERYYHENVKFMEAFPSIFKTLETVFAGEKVMDKLTAVSLLGVYKVYFSKD